MSDPDPSISDGRSYLKSDWDINRVNNIDALESLLSEVDIKKNKIILYGSSIMALTGIRPNNDLEFIPKPEQRNDFRNFAQKDSKSRINDEGQMFFPKDIHSSRPNRFKLFGWDDAKIFENSECYVECSGYKFLKLELIVSQKAADRRPKDLEDLRMLENNGYIGGPGWNWELVVRLPPWERPSKMSLWDQGIDSLKSDGLATTGVRLFNYLKTQKIEDNISSLSEVWNKFQVKRKLAPGIVNQLETHYPAPDLFIRQINTKNGFERYDLIAAILYLEGEKRFQQYLEEERESTSHITITPNGRISGGIYQLAKKWKLYSDQDALQGSEITFPVEVTQDPPLPTRSDDWISDRFNSETINQLKQKRRDLLQNSGAVFYAVLWPAVENNFDEIEAWICDQVTVIHSYDFDLKCNLEEFIRSVYTVDERPMQWETEKKINELLSRGTNVRILKLQISDPQFRSWDGPRLSDRVHSLKMSCRRNFQSDVEDYEYDVIIHITDNYNQNSHFNTILTKLKEFDKSDIT